MSHTVQKGFSIVEVLLAGAVFVVFAYGVVEVLLTGLQVSRLDEEMTIATGYATEGMEAVRFIAEQNFDALEIVEATGLEKEDGAWIFRGSENSMDGKFTRVIRIDPVARDSGGYITNSDGTEDQDTVRVTVTVSWKMSPTRDDSVVFETYYTRWKP